MYAHKVIESLNSIVQYDQKEAASITKDIYDSQKFYFGEGPTLAGLFTKTNKHLILFEGKLKQDINPPYELSWFDVDLPKKNNSLNSTSVSFLIKHLKKTNEILILCFPRHEKYGWIAFSVVWLISLDLNISEHPRYSENLIYRKPYRSSENQSDLAIEGMQSFVGYANFALILLNCKNIETQENPPPLKLNKKRKKTGKQPLFTYKTLVIKPTGKKQESQAAQGLWDNRVHLCRGHFKEYTADKPLFGKITGRFWWQPSVRGRSRDGVVMKNYKIEA